MKRILVMIVLLMMWTSTSLAGEEITSPELLNVPSVTSGVSTGSASAEAGKERPAGVYTSLAELREKRIGVQSGTSFDALVTQKVENPEILYFNTKADLVEALSGNRIDAFVADDPVILRIMAENPLITTIPEYVDSYQFAFVFPKTEEGAALRDQFNEFLKKIRADGLLDELTEKWISSPAETKAMMDYSALPAVNGTLRMGTESGYEPFEYVQDGVIVGYDIEIAARFCEARGYALEITDMSYDAILPALSAGKCDFAGAGISITPERAESVFFSEPNFEGGAAAAVLRAESPDEAKKSASFWENIQISFEKTFLRESRWELFLQGVLTTLLITLASALLGTLLGFLVFMACRNGNPLANGAVRLFSSFLQGMPMVVLLMILYYIIFGNVSISGTIVSVIGFSLTFASSVLGMLRMGVGAVDSGQYEAARALGYTDEHTFFKIILPQAMPHILPAYKGEIIGLIKATAVVGYIAVQDLTKMSDIVRSRTYEAFFPLIAITVIYFLLEALFIFLINRIKINPKRRRSVNLLKGVKTDDQN